MAIVHRCLLFSLLCYAWSTSDAPRSCCVLACFAIVAGRRATADGSVLVGHNEQDRGPCLVSFDWVPRQPLAEAVPERLRYSRCPTSAGHTASFLWSQCVGKRAADSVLNEYGVAVVSNKCPTREDPPAVLAARGDLVDGGIGYLLRRLVAQQATTAREGVVIAGELVERFGYTPPGRTYVVADTDEAWLMAVVGSRRWVAQRVPDEAVVVVPNVHVLRGVDLVDTDHFLGSADLINYAVRRGWYDPAIDGPFDFRRVYRQVRANGNGSGTRGATAGLSSSVETRTVVPDTRTSSQRPDESDPRRWWAHRLITDSEIPWPPEGPLPLWIRPREPMSVGAMAAILRSRGGQKPLSTTETVEASVLQLRAGLPRAIGCVYWRITCEPSSGVLVPWYLGISRVPDNYHEPASLARRLSLEYQFSPSAETFEPKPELAWWKFKTLERRVHEDYDGRIVAVRGAWAELENRLMAGQESVERETLRLWQQDPQNPGAASDYLTRCCAGVADEACREADRLVGLFDGRATESVARPHLAR